MAGRLAPLIGSLREIPGVEGIGVGGSRALKASSLDSDWDLVIFRDEGRPIDSGSVYKAIFQVCAPGTLKRSGSYISGISQDQTFEIFQKDLKSIQIEIEASRLGKFGWGISPLFPHGDITTRTITHIRFLDILWQKDSKLTNLQNMALPFPEPLGRSLTEFFLNRAGACIIQAQKVLASGITAELAGYISAVAFYFGIAICAINRQYPVIEKGWWSFVERQVTKPPAYSVRLQECFEKSFSGEPANAIGTLISLLSEIRGLNSFSAPRSIRLSLG